MKIVVETKKSNYVDLIQYLVQILHHICFRKNIRYDFEKSRDFSRRGGGILFMKQSEKHVFWP